MSERASNRQARCQTVLLPAALPCPPGHTPALRLGPALLPARQASRDTAARAIPPARTPRAAMRRLSLVLLGLILGVLYTPVSQAGARPRILVVPIKGSPELDGQTSALTRAAVQGLLSAVTVIELRASGVTPTLQACVFKPSCIDSLLEANRADAVLTGELDSSGTKLLLMVVAPSWPVSYAERQVSTTPARVASEALQVLVMAMGTVLTDASRSDKSSGSEEGVVPERIVHPEASTQVALAEPSSDPKGKGKKGKDGKGADKKGADKKGADKKGADKKAANKPEADSKPTDVARVSPSAGDSMPAAGSGAQAGAHSPDPTEAASRKPARSGSLADAIEADAREEVSLDTATALDEEAAKPAPKPSKKKAPPVEAVAEDEESYDSEDPDATSDEDLLPEEDPDLEALPDESESQARKRSQKKPPALKPSKSGKKKKKKALAWPAPGDESGWRGMVLEGGASGAFGALAVNINSRLSVDAQSVVYRYQWAVRENAASAFLHLGANFSLGPYLELGVVGGAFPAGKQLVLYTDYPAPTTDYEAEGEGFDWHFYVGGVLKVFPIQTLKARPYVGLGAGWWHVPGFHSESLASQAHSLPASYERLGLEASGGARFLVSPRIFLSLEGRVLIDPSGYLLKDLSGLTAMDISQLTTPPPASRTVGSLGLGVGYLF